MVACSNIIYLLLVITVESFSPVWSHERRGFLHAIRIQPTVGEPWPKPQSILTTTQRLTVNPKTFHFLMNETSQRCSLLTSAFDRYYRIIFFPQTYMPYIRRSSSSFTTNNDIYQTKINASLRQKYPSSITNISLLMNLYVNVEQPCDEWPSLETNESYTLFIKNNHAALNAITVWGALRGLETFSQLIYTDDDLLFAINETIINDFPRFQHRGLLLDTSRHFISVNTIKMNLVDY
ncbi:unnamed protein product [Rotaria sp. Silwood1]|nr:unnamed protein product [Rotaria sp. Silwood1]CAF4960373.1 unnamed protein product [Rotaria sp. Silwood1]